MIYPTVQLRGNGTVGSGVIIYSEVQPEASPEGRELYSTFLLTAYHVVLEVLGERMDSGTLNEVHVLLEGQSDTSQVFGAKLVLFDRPRDLALLRINSARKFRHVAELVGMDDFRSIDVFARAYAVGCPLGNRPLPTIGEISSKQKAVGDQVFWMLSAPTFYGNSGGGIYLADGYKLIGVSSMIYTYGKTHPAVVPHMGLFVPMDTIRRWLDAEGFSFLYEGRPIPRELLWKLAYVDLPDLPSSRPRAAADVSRSRKMAGEKNLDLPLGR
jgi:S1-C subfamily serine protease